MKSIYKALAAFQQECGIIHKGTQGYGYSYASLSEILETINPLLAKHGLGFTQTVNGSQLCTTIFHVESGEHLEGCADIPQNVQLKGMNDFQVLGSAITYMRRYQLSAMLGLVTDKDTDAHGEQTPKQPTQKAVKWLNPNTQEWAKAVEYLAGGGVLSDIKKKYSISKENEDKLMDAVLG